MTLAFMMLMLRRLPTLPWVFDTPFLASMPPIVCVSVLPVLHMNLAALVVIVRVVTARVGFTCTVFHVMNDLTEPPTGVRGHEIPPFDEFSPG